MITANIQGMYKDKMMLCVMTIRVHHIQIGCSSLCCGLSLDLDAIVILICHEQNIFLETEKKKRSICVIEQCVA